MVALAGVDVDADGDEEDGDEGEVDDGVDEYGDAAGVEVGELHHPPALPWYLEQQPRRQQHEQHHRYHHRPPIRHPRSCLSSSPHCVCREELEGLGGERKAQARGEGKVKGDGEGHFAKEWVGRTTCSSGLRYRWRLTRASVAVAL
ncbi:hypothetical protein B296_00004595 [Ensete ventricosum]|uniref:Uncharacterized protein n=1 Tax=Ensete ventricosum TaxID=4639 RepID=A0A427B2M2_ENSVE|nr:hypothetical protein B296_00004595 [Ensete ventricosum]